MKVRDLILKLEKLSQDDEVILSKDGEGNGFSPLSRIELVIYVPDSAWSGEIHIRELTPILENAGFTDEDLYDGDNGQKSVVFFPIG